MIQYLLGELPADDSDRFEERYFTNHEAFEHLLAVKAELIDRYLHRRLSKEETDRFESFFLQSPNHRREVAIVRSLLSADAEAKAFAVSQVVVKAKLASWFKQLFGALPARGGLVAGALAVLLMAGFAWLIIDNRRTRAELAALRAESIEREQELRQLVAILQSQSSTTMPTPTPTVSPSPNVSPSLRPSSGRELSRSAVFAITLAPGQARTAGTLPELIVPVDATNQADLSAATRKIRLRLLLTDQYPDYGSYAVALKNEGGRTMQTRAGLRVISTPSGQAIEVEFSANQLKSGEYAATLSGLPAPGRREEIADYPFRIVKL